MTSRVVLAAVLALGSPAQAQSDQVDPFIGTSGEEHTFPGAFDDWTIARMARAIGRTDVAAMFEKRAGNWRNTFDPMTGFVRASFDPTAINYGSDYTEGNAWQYSWFVPQDQAAMGGDAATVAKLDAMFDYDNSKLDYSHAEDIAGLIGQDIHGNAPSHHVAYLYNYAGAPNKTWATQPADRPYSMSTARR